MNLMDYLPPIYDGNATMQELQDILTDKINTMISYTGATVDECFINTASKLLNRYEKIYGCTVDVTKSDTARREILKAKIRGIGTITKQLIIDTAASYSNGTVEVIEKPTDYSFVVKFTGTLGIPKNMAGLTETINQIKPAHLAYSFIYTFITWDKVEAYSHTWDEWDALGLTWDAFETYKEDT
ncbi:DUF2313 domain-containing protein [Caproiciproducens galactitolivorans]|uniref:DUF2313 domain-containing protein n=1 Tax=Caproiciproducens galactitolivorans TaxID=642589 RepID=A0A4Z0Y7H2_9FIRM|nr:putative phage tail protein [Caproiciproducens galactitolivorans]QEY33741.1 DUF2313 domain-containing protein [Caproiciproducens galactitolivorans]TGJ75475.1 hypothetical protein CAGA_23540 [Caproiciproducens galactitolivorans]